MRLKLKKSLVCLDVETTGLDIVNDRIVEIAMIKLMPSGERKEKTIRINPTIPIPKETTMVHGITDEMVKNCPKFSEVANEIKQFIQDAELCGYNSQKFDIPILNEEFLRAGIDMDLSKIVSIDVQKIYHKMEPRDLPAAYRFYCGKTLDGHHNAKVDAEATLDVFLAQVEKYKDLADDTETINKFLGSSESLDSMNRIVMKDGKTPMFNFGKHKGKSVAQVLKEEPQYYDWMMKSDFSLHTKKVLSELYVKFTLENK